MSAPISARNSSPTTKIFCDLDGVLCDFNGGVERILGEPLTEETSAKRLWSAVSRDKNFFLNLDWTHDGKILWEAIAPLKPSILTGVPSNKTDVYGKQKAKWCERELLYVFDSDDSGINRINRINHIDMTAHKPQRHELVSGVRSNGPTDIEVISCWSRFKHKECASKGMILIDDRIKAKAEWERSGGIFVHHTSSEDSLRQLQNLGVINGSGEIGSSPPSPNQNIEQAMVP